MKKIMIFAAFILALTFNPAKAQDYGNYDDGDYQNGDYQNNDSQTYHGYTHERETFNYFYDSLSPYGEWLELDNNVYAWHPYGIGRRWQPYTVGRWVWSADGWYWDSYEPFGWATYHYGRWYFDDYYGWIWIPDDQWGPAWVEWRYSDDYIGWAPLPPYAIFDIHVGIHFNYDWHFPYSCWNFMPYRYFDGYDVNHYYVTPREKYRLYSNTRYRNDYAYRDGRVINRGVDRQFVEQRIGRNIQQRDIVQTRTRDMMGNRSRDNNRVEVFRPGRQDLAKTRDIGTLNIRRPERGTTLDVNKIDRRMGNNIGRENINRSGRNNQNPVVRDRGNQNNGNQPPRVETPTDRGNRQNQGNRNGNDERQNNRIIEKQGNNPNLNPPVNRNENPNWNRPENNQERRRETPRIENRGNQTPQVRENRPPEKRNEPEVRANKQNNDRQNNDSRGNDRGSERDRRR